MPYTIVSTPSNRGAHVKIRVNVSERVGLILNPDSFIEATMMLDAIERNIDECFREIVDSSPVDEGDYQLAWSRKNYKRGKTYYFNIHNDAQYAKYLVYGMDINFKRFLRTSRGLTGKSYKYPDPARGIIHDVRRIVWNQKNKMISDLRKRRVTFNWRTGVLRIKSNIAATTSFTAGERY